MSIYGFLRLTKRAVGGVTYLLTYLLITYSDLPSEPSVTAVSMRRPKHGLSQSTRMRTVPRSCCPAVREKEGV